LTGEQPQETIEPVTGGQPAADVGGDAEGDREHARACFREGAFEEAFRAASHGLKDARDDVELLLLAGRAGVELDNEDAVGYLRRATELAAQDGPAWRYLGEALAAEGSYTEAEQAFRRAVEIDPADQVAVAHLGHTALASGRRDEGIGLLARATDGPQGASAIISLVDMYRSVGQNDEALAQARKLTEVDAEDTLAWLDVAELSLAVGELDAAEAAFERVRELDDVPGREAYPLHGMIEAQILGEDWQRARELAAQATTIEGSGLGGQVTAYLATRAGAEPQPEAPSLERVLAALQDSLGDYRRMLAEDRRLGPGEQLA
jgi:tetratricopeptide (TPR) repeat protein